jgi:hypothetical protein
MTSHPSYSLQVGAAAHEEATRVPAPRARTVRAGPSLVIKGLYPRVNSSIRGLGESPTAMQYTSVS